MPGSILRSSWQRRLRSRIDAEQFKAENIKALDPIPLQGIGIEGFLRSFIKPKIQEWRACPALDRLKADKLHRELYSITSPALNRIPPTISVNQWTPERNLPTTINAVKAARVQRMTFQNVGL